MQLKTLFLSSNTVESMTVIPALPYKFDKKGKDKCLFVPIVAQAYHKDKRESRTGFCL